MSAVLISGWPDGLLSACPVAMWQSVIWPTQRQFVLLAPAPDQRHGVSELLKTSL